MPSAGRIMAVVCLITLACVQFAGSVHAQSTELARSSDYQMYIESMNLVERVSRSYKILDNAYALPEFVEASQQAPHHIELCLRFLRDTHDRRLREIAILTSAAMKKDDQIHFTKGLLRLFEEKKIYQWELHRSIWPGFKITSKFIFLYRDPDVIELLTQVAAMPTLDSDFKDDIHAILSGDALWSMVMRWIVEAAHLRFFPNPVDLVRALWLLAGPYTLVALIVSALAGMSARVCRNSKCA